MSIYERVCPLCPQLLGQLADEHIGFVIVRDGDYDISLVDTRFVENISGQAITMDNDCLL